MLRKVIKQKQYTIYDLCEILDSTCDAVLNEANEQGQDGDIDYADYLIDIVNNGNANLEYIRNRFETNTYLNPLRFAEFLKLLGADRAKNMTQLLNLHKDVITKEIRRLNDLKESIESTADDIEKFMKV